MDLKEIRQIIEMMKRHDLSLFHLERDGIKIKLKKGVDFETLVKTVSNQGMGGYAGPMPSSAIRIDPMLPATSSAGLDDSGEEAAPTGGGTPASGPTFKSPMVGTFYRSPAPGETPYSKDGDRVSEGQVICIIEAMKVMNEIKAERAGVLVRCLINDGTPVQYDQPLFEVRPV